MVLSNRAVTASGRAISALIADGLVALGFQGFGQFLCRPGRVGIIDDNGKTIGRQTFGKGNANAARGTR